MRKLIARPGMYIKEGSLTYAVAFVSGLSNGQEPNPLTGFRDWIAKNYFKHRHAQTWEYLIEKIPQCSTGNEEDDVRAFLNILSEYLDTVEAA